jgi:hypothetical protein
MVFHTYISSAYFFILISFGLSFFGRRFSEATLVKYACAFEAATNVRPVLCSCCLELTSGLLLVPPIAEPIHYPQYPACRCDVSINGWCFQATRWFPQSREIAVVSVLT